MATDRTAYRLTGLLKRPTLSGPPLAIRDAFSRLAAQPYQVGAGLPQSACVAGAGSRDPRMLGLGPREVPTGNTCHGRGRGEVDRGGRPPSGRGHEWAHD